MSDPYYAAEPEILPFVRRERKAAAEIPDRLEHAGRRPAPYHRRQSTRGAPAVRGRALLFQPGPQAAAGRTHPATGEGHLSQQARQPTRPVQRTKLLAGKIARML